MRDSVQLLQALIRNECVNDGTIDSGFESRSVETLQEFFDDPGEVRERQPGRGSLVYRIPGTDPSAPSLMLMGHTDVVPANPDGWDVDPFAAEIREGYVWGRGAVDMLNLTATMATVFSQYLNGSMPPLPGDLVYLAVADEEGGGRYGAQFLVDEYWDLVACDYLMTEIGQPRVMTPTGPFYPITTTEKGPMWRKFHSRGVPGHGSQPYGRENAVIDMAAAITRLVESSAPVHISDEWRAIVETGAFGELSEMLVSNDLVDEAIEILSATDIGLARWVHALTHMTFSPNMVHGGVKSNVIPDSTEADVDVRVLPGHDVADVDDHFRKALGDLYDRIEIVPAMDDHVANSSPSSGLLWEAIGDGLQAVEGTRDRFPMMITGTTDSRFFRPRGTVAYGVGLYEHSLKPSDFAAMFHGNNEKVSLESIERTERLLFETVAAFGRRSAVE